MKSGSRSDIGRQRKSNEDSHYIDEKMGLYIVADGMGGHRGGRTASGMAVGLISRYVKDNMPKSPDKEAVYRVLLDSAYMANDQIRNVASNQSELSGMGTTLTLALSYGDVLYILNIGDSRAYIIRGGAISQLTEDDSLIAHMVKKGMISEEEAKTHRMKNVVTQALGTRDYLTPSIVDIEIKKDDYVLLCSDGLTGMLPDEDIRDIVLKHKGDPEKACAALVRRANKYGGRDNITVIVLHTD